MDSDRNIANFNLLGQLLRFVQRNLEMTPELLRRMQVSCSDLSKL